MQAVCTGFIYALAIADKFVRAGSSSRALVIGAETLSRITDWTDRGTCVLFGDGAGAVVLGDSETPGIVSSHLHADGQYKDLLCVPAGISKGYDKVVSGEAYMHMAGSEVFKVAVNTLGRIVDETLEVNGIKNPTSPGWSRTRRTSASSPPPRRNWACRWTRWC